LDANNCNFDYRVRGVKAGLSQQGKNVRWGCTRMGAEKLTWN